MGVHNEVVREMGQYEVIDRDLRHLLGGTERWHSDVMYN